MDSTNLSGNLLNSLWRFFDAPYDVLTDLSSTGVDLDSILAACDCDQNSWSSTLLATIISEMDVSDSEKQSELLDRVFDGDDTVCGAQQQVLSGDTSLQYMDRMRAVTPVQFQDPNVWTTQNMLEHRHALLMDRVAGSSRQCAFPRFPLACPGDMDMGLQIGTAWIDRWSELFQLVHGFSSGDDKPSSDKPVINMADKRTRDVLTTASQQGMVINATGDFGIKASGLFDMMGTGKHPIQFVPIEAPALQLITDQLYTDFVKNKFRLPKFDVQGLLASAMLHTVRPNPVLVTKGTPQFFLHTPHMYGSHKQAVENPISRKLPSSSMTWTDSKGSAKYFVQSSKTQPYSSLIVELDMAIRCVFVGDKPSVARKIDPSKPACLKLHPAVLNTPTAGVINVYPVYYVQVKVFASASANHKGELLHSQSELCVSSIPVTVRVLDPHTELLRCAGVIQEQVQSEWRLAPPAIYVRETQDKVSVETKQVFSPHTAIETDMYKQHVGQLATTVLDQSILMSHSTTGMLSALSSASGNSDSGIEQMQKNATKTQEKLRTQEPSSELISSAMMTAGQLQQLTRLMANPEQMRMLTKCTDATYGYMHLSSLCKFIPLVHRQSTTLLQVVGYRGYSQNLVQQLVSSIRTYLDSILVQHPALHRVPQPGLNVDLTSVGVISAQTSGITSDVNNLVQASTCEDSFKRILDRATLKDGLFGATKESMFHDNVHTLGEVVVRARKEGGITGILLSSGNSALKRVLGANAEASITSVSQGILSCLFNGVGYVVSPEQILVGLVEQTRAVAPQSRLTSKQQPIVAPEDLKFDANKWLDAHLQYPLSNYTRTKAAECRRAINKLASKQHKQYLKVNSNLHELCVLQRKHHGDTWVSPELERVWESMQVDGSFFTLELWSEDLATQSHVLLAADFCHSVMREVYVATRCTNDLFKAYQSGFILAFSAQSYLASLGYMSYDLGGADRGAQMKYKTSLALYEDGDVAALRHNMNLELGPITYQSSDGAINLYKPFQHKIDYVVVDSLMKI